MPVTPNTDGPSFEIQPGHINAQAHFFGAFGHNETEKSAGWIIRFLQERGQGWAPFSRDELNARYQQKWPDHHFQFNRLLNNSYGHSTILGGYDDSPIPAGTSWIVVAEDNRLYVTEDFVRRCFRSSPAADAIQAEA